MGLTTFAARRTQLGFDTGQQAFLCVLVHVCTGDRWEAQLLQCLAVKSYISECDERFLLVATLVLVEEVCMGLCASGFPILCLLAVSDVVRSAPMLACKKHWEGFSTCKSHI